MNMDSLWCVLLRRRIAFALVCLALAPGLLGCGGQDKKTYRILMVGDSWAFMMGYQRSLANVMATTGHAQYAEYVNLFHLTAIPGTTSNFFVHNTLGVMDSIDYVLRTHPEIDIVHLSIGGNDAIDEWMPNLTSDQENALFSKIVDNTRKIVEHILAQRANIRVAICGYDYMEKQFPGVTYKVFNEACVELVSSIDRCKFIDNFGLMQYEFGYPGGTTASVNGPEIYQPHEVAPPGNESNNYTPFAGGDINYPSPADSLAVWLYTDGIIHLNRKGYEVVAQNCLEQYYNDWLDNPLPAPAK
jgi:hypothetical protein